MAEQAAVFRMIHEECSSIIFNVINKDIFGSNKFVWEFNAGNVNPKYPCEEKWQAFPPQVQLQIEAAMVTYGDYQLDFQIPCKWWWGDNETEIYWTPYEIHLTSTDRGFHWYQKNPGTSTVRKIRCIVDTTDLRAHVRAAGLR